VINQQYGVTRSDSLGMPDLMLNLGHFPVTFSWRPSSPQIIYIQSQQCGRVVSVAAEI